MRNARLTFALAAALSCFGCSRCGREGGAREELLQLLPRDAEAVLVVPDIARLGQDLSSLEQLKVASFAAQLQGFPSASELVSSLMQQVGFDLRSREALEKAGVDPARGLAVVLLPGGHAYSAIAVRDAGAFRDALAKLARDRLGAGQVSTRRSGDLEITTFSANPALRAAMVLRGGFALVGGEDLAASLEGRAQVAPAASLSQDAAFAAASGRLPKERDFIGYFPPASAAGREYSVAGGAISGAISRREISLSLDLPWASVQRALSRASAAAPSPYGALAPDAFLVARYGGDPASLDGVWPRLVGPRAAGALRDAGFDVPSEVLSNVQPGAVLSLSLSSQVSFAQPLGSVDPRRVNPFRYVGVVAAAVVRDVAKAAATLEKLPSLAPAVGAQLRPAQVGGLRAFLATYSQGEGLDLALAGDRLLAAAPQARFSEALGRASGADAGPGPLGDPELRAALEKEPFAIAVDLRALRESVKALPGSAWGVGGFAIKASTVRWLDATDDLRAVTGWARARDGAVQAELTLRLTGE